jgi:hypothetical protein
MKTHERALAGNQTGRNPANPPTGRSRARRTQNQLISSFFKGFQRFSNQKIELPPI